MSTRVWSPLLLFGTRLSCLWTRSSAPLLPLPRAQGIWLEKGSAGARRHGSGWIPGVGKEKAQQESIALTLPASAMRGGPLGSPAATISGIFGPSLALALTQLSVSTAHLYSQAMTLWIR